MEVCHYINDQDPKSGIEIEIYKPAMYEPKHMIVRSGKRYYVVHEKYIKCEEALLEVKD